jgi:hypothetical protein
MRPRRLLPALFAVLFVGVVHGPTTIQIFASIVDAASGAPVTSLDPADVRVVENGAEAKIARIDRVEWPMKVQVLVDNGAGLGSENLQHLRNGVKGLLEAMPAGVEVSLLTIAPQRVSSCGRRWIAFSYSTASAGFRPIPARAGSPNR